MSNIDTIYYMLIDFAVIDGPSMFDVLGSFVAKGYIQRIDNLLGYIETLDERAMITLYGLTFEQAVEIGEALDNADLDLQWMHYEEEPESTRE